MISVLCFLCYEMCLLITTIILIHFHTLIPFPLLAFVSLVLLFFVINELIIPPYVVYLLLICLFLCSIYMTQLNKQHNLPLIIFALLRLPHWINLLIFKYSFLFSLSFNPFHPLFVLIVLLIELKFAYYLKYNSIIIFLNPYLY